MIQAIIKLFNQLLQREFLIVIILSILFAHTNILENSPFIIRSALYAFFLYCIVRFLFKLLGGTETTCSIQQLEPRDLEEIEKTAYHEAGHAIVGRLLNAHIRELSVVPTPSANRCGHIEYKFKGNCHGQSVFYDMIETTLAGMAAEIVIYGETSSGPYGDLTNAKREALHMIEDLGMGKKLLYQKDDPDIFIEANKILEHAKIRAIIKLKTYSKVLHSLKQLLMKKQTLNEEEIENFFKSHEI